MFPPLAFSVPTIPAEAEYKTLTHHREFEDERSLTCHRGTTAMGAGLLPECAHSSSQAAGPATLIDRLVPLA
eukprot:12898811-Prorocentrum_lima.AAC.1